MSTECWNCDETAKEMIAPPWEPTNIKPFCAACAQKERNGYQVVASMQEFDALIATDCNWKKWVDLSYDDAIDAWETKIAPPPIPAYGVEYSLGFIHTTSVEGQALTHSLRVTESWKYIFVEGGSDLLPDGFKLATGHGAQSAWHHFTGMAHCAGSEHKAVYAQWRAFVRRRLGLRP